MELGRARLQIIGKVGLYLGAPEHQKGAQAMTENTKQIEDKLSKITVQGDVKTEILQILGNRHIPGITRTNQKINTQKLMMNILPDKIVPKKGFSVYT